MGKPTTSVQCNFMRLKDRPYDWKIEEKLRSLHRVVIILAVLILGAIVPISPEGSKGKLCDVIRAAMNWEHSRKLKLK